MAILKMIAAVLIADQMQFRFSRGGIILPPSYFEDSKDASYENDYNTDNYGSIYGVPRDNDSDELGTRDQSNYIDNYESQSNDGNQSKQFADIGNILFGSNDWGFGGSDIFGWLLGDFNTEDPTSVGFNVTIGEGYRDTTTRGFRDTSGASEDDPSPVNGDGTTTENDFPTYFYSSKSPKRVTSPSNGSAPHIPDARIDFGTTYIHSDYTSLRQAESCTIHGHLCPKNSTCNDRYGIVFCECNTGMTGSQCQITHPCLQDVLSPCPRDKVYRICVHRGACAQEMCYMDVCSGCVPGWTGKWCDISDFESNAPERYVKAKLLLHIILSLFILSF